MQPSLTTEQWAEVDAYIIAGNVLGSIQVIRRFTGLGIKQAIDINHQRYQLLRADRPNDFKQDHEEYWRGYYS